MSAIAPAQFLEDEDEPNPELRLFWEFRDRLWRVARVGTQPAGGVAVGASSVTVIGPNPFRRGLSIVNLGPAIVFLTLGDQAAVVNTALALSASLGSWDGRLSGCLWMGSVQAISSAGGNTIGVVEV